MVLYYKGTGRYTFPTSRYVDTSKNRKSKPVPIIDTGYAHPVF